jgi:hypothetical protein
MSFVSVLEKIGSVIAEGLIVVSGAEPIVANLTGSGSKATSVATDTTNDLTSIAQLVIQITAVAKQTGLTPAQKVAAYTALTSQVLQTSEIVSGHQITDAQGFSNAAAQIAQGVEALLNSLNSDAIKTSGSPLPAPSTVSQPAAPSQSAMPEAAASADTNMPTPPIE